MSENLFSLLRAWVLEELAVLLPELTDELLRKVELTPTRDVAHGDMASNAAMVVAKPVGKNQSEHAYALAEALSRRSGIAKAEPAGPGFVTLTLDAALLRQQLPVIL